jgi:hypothetical protein
VGKDSDGEVTNTEKKKRTCNKKHQVQEQQKLQSFGKSSGVIP